MLTITVHKPYPHLLLTNMQPLATWFLTGGVANPACPHRVQCMLTIVQPAATAILPAVSFVAMPPVPHCVPLVLVSALSVEKSSTSEIGLALGSSCSGQYHDKQVGPAAV